MSWDAGGIVFGQGSKGIMRVSANGGQPEVLVSVKDGEVVYGPQVLPGGEWVLFTLATAATADGWDKAQIVVQSLKSSERKTLVSGGSDGRYLPTGHLVYALGGVLFAVPFDLRRLAVTGGPVPIVEGVRRSTEAPTGTAHFSVSSTGSLVYVPGPASTSSAQLDLALVDRNGAVQPLKLPPGPYQYPRLSPDGKRIAVGSDDGKDASHLDLRPGGRELDAPAHVGRPQSCSRLVRGRRARGVSVGPRGRSRHLLAARGRHDGGGAPDEAGQGHGPCAGVVVARWQDVVVQCRQGFQLRGRGVVAPGQEGDTRWRHPVAVSSLCDVFTRRPMGGVLGDCARTAPPVPCSSSRFPRPARRIRSRKPPASIPRGLPMGRSCSTLRAAAAGNSWR